MIPRMLHFGRAIRMLRENAKLSRDEVSSTLGISVLELETIEHGNLASAQHLVPKVAEVFGISKDILSILFYESNSYVASNKDSMNMTIQEPQVLYVDTIQHKLNSLMVKTDAVFSQFPTVQKAYVFGSYARSESDAQSDLDLALEVDSLFSYFDLAELNVELEKALNLKVDLGFLDSFKADVFKRILPELKLIYEKQTEK